MIKSIKKKNREKRNAYKKEWRNKNKHKAKEYYEKVYKFKEDKNKTRDNRFKRTYGISLDDYNQMLIDQKGCCLICEKHASELNKSLAIDHCHKTGKIRGLLCSRCNVGIGLLEEDLKIFENCIKYLKNAHT